MRRPAIDKDDESKENEKFADSTLIQMNKSRNFVPKCFCFDRNQFAFVCPFEVAHSKHDSFDSLHYQSAATALTAGGLK